MLDFSLCSTVLKLNGPVIIDSCAECARNPNNADHADWRQSWSMFAIVDGKCNGYKPKEATDG